MLRIDKYGIRKRDINNIVLEEYGTSEKGNETTKTLGYFTTLQGATVALTCRLMENGCSANGDITLNTVKQVNKKLAAMERNIKEKIEESL